MNFKNVKKVKQAFTLAEMLIVIVIIGVIAAIVTPIIVSNANKVKFVSGLQKANNTFANVVNHAQSDSPMESWNYNQGTEEFVKEYILPRLNVVENCGMAETGCFAESYNANNLGATTIDNTYYKVMLTDGVAVGIKVLEGCTDDNPSQCIDFIVDVNGKEKPNTWGRDLYNFEGLANLNAIVPFGTFASYDPNTKKWTFAEDGDAAAKCPSQDERYCALRVINDGWEINY